MNYQYATKLHPIIPHRSSPSRCSDRRGRAAEWLPLFCGVPCPLLHDHCQLGPCRLPYGKIGEERNCGWVRQFVIAEHPSSQAKSRALPCTIEATLQHPHHLHHLSLHSINLQQPIHYVLPLHLRHAQYVPPSPRGQKPGTKLTCVFLSLLTAFQSRLKGAELLTVQCQNCGNLSGHVYRRWQWFTFCFVPVIPLSVKPWHVSSSALSSPPLPQSHVRQPSNSPPATSQ